MNEKVVQYNMHRAMSDVDVWLVLERVSETEWLSFVGGAEVIYYVETH